MGKEIVHLSCLPLVVDNSFFIQVGKILLFC